MWKKFSNCRSMRLSRCDPKELVSEMPGSRAQTPATVEWDSSDLSFKCRSEIGELVLKLDDAVHRRPLVQVRNRSASL